LFVVYLFVVYLFVVYLFVVYLFVVYLMVVVSNGSRWCASPAVLEVELEVLVASASLVHIEQRQGLGRRASCNERPRLALHLQTRNTEMPKSQASASGVLA
jgi:hypothetical protein